MSRRTPADPFDLSLVWDDAPMRWQRRIGLVPHAGLGVVRRAIFWTAVAWLPVVIWAWWTGRALGSQGQVAEPLLAHFGVHARLLVAIPLLIIADAVAHHVASRLVPQFVHAGLVTPDDVPRFRAILAKAARRRAAVVPWIVFLGMAIAWTLADTVVHRAHELTWAAEASAPTSLGFGGWWYVYVGRSIFIVLVLGWLWRLYLLGSMLRRIAGLDLALVPTHADRAGGLGFVERFPTAFSLVVLALSIVTAAGWAHDVRFHTLDVRALYPTMAVALGVTLVIFLAPYLAFVGPLVRAKKAALLNYGGLVARHGEAVHEKWIAGKAGIDDPLLEAPEIGPVADTVALYELVDRMRPVPIGKAGLLAIALPAVIPFIGVLAMQIPIKEILQQLVKGLL